MRIRTGPPPTLLDETTGAERCASRRPRVANAGIQATATLAKYRLLAARTLSQASRRRVATHGIPLAGMTGEPPPGADRMKVGSGRLGHRHLGTGE